MAERPQSLSCRWTRSIRAWSPACSPLEPLMPAPPSSNNHVRRLHLKHQRRGVWAWFLSCNQQRWWSILSRGATATQACFSLLTMSKACLGTPTADTQQQLSFVCVPPEGRFLYQQFDPRLSVWLLENWVSFAFNHINVWAQVRGTEDQRLSPSPGPYPHDTGTHPI